MTPRGIGLVGTLVGASLIYVASKVWGYVERKDGSSKVISNIFGFILYAIGFPLLLSGIGTMIDPTWIPQPSGICGPGPEC